MLRHGSHLTNAQTIVLLSSNCFLESVCPKLMLIKKRGRKDGKHRCLQLKKTRAVLRKALQFSMTRMNQNNDCEINCQYCCAPSYVRSYYDFTLTIFIKIEIA